MLPAFFDTGLAGLVRCAPSSTDPGENDGLAPSMDHRHVQRPGNLSKLRLRVQRSNAQDAFAFAVNQQHPKREDVESGYPLSPCPAIRSSDIHDSHTFVVD